MNMELVVDLLEAEGHTLLQATDAEHGILLARSACPDLILMDVALPGMDGLQATQILKTDSLTHAIPIVALTAHAMAGDAAKALAAGCAGYLAKPINTRTFVSNLAGYIDKASLPLVA